MPGTDVTGAVTAHDPPLCYRKPAAGRLLGDISRRMVDKLISLGELETVPVGNLNMVTRESIDAYVTRQKNKSKASA